MLWTAHQRYCRRQIVTADWVGQKYIETRKRANMAETNDQSAGQGDLVPGSGLIDLSDTPLQELLHRDDPVLAHALQRVTTEACHLRGDVVSAFGSSIL